MFVFKLLSLRRGSQDLLLLHGLGVTSRELPMPFELQKSNRLKRGSRCPLKDYNQICIASEPLCYLTVVTTGKFTGTCKSNLQSVNLDLHVL